MRFHLLGALEVESNDRPVPLSGLKQRATLGFLLLHSNRVVATSQLLKALWSDNTPETARKMLQNAVSGLRRVLRSDEDPTYPALLLSHAPGYMLQVDPESIDLLRFQRLAEWGRAELAASSWESASTILREALALWRGPALADLVEKGISWSELTAVQNTRLAAFEDCFEAELAAGRHSAVVGELEMLVDTEPPRERLCAQLMLALHRCGRSTDALAVYRRTRTALIDQFGLEPGRALRELEQSILRYDPGLAVPFPRSVVVRRTAPEVPDATTSAEVAVERKLISVVLVKAQLGPHSADQADDPEDVDELLAGVTATIQAEVGRLDGTVAGAVGAVSLALFGVPHTHEDDAVRAVRAAIAIRDRVAASRPASLPPFTTQVAVATGEALVRYRPDRPDSPPVVTGSVLDSCMRLLAWVPTDGVRICDTTRQAAEPFVAGAPVGDGSGGWEVTSLSPEREAHGRAQVAVPFVEREQEMQLITELFEQSHRHSRPHLVTVLGDPGIGKSRLIAELSRSGERHPAVYRCLTGCTPSFGQDAAMAALAEVVISYTGVLSTDPAGEVHRKLAKAVHHLIGTGEEAAWMLAHLRVLVGLDEDGSGRGDTSETFQVLRRFLQQIAAEHTLVLIIEDVHWADDTMLDFLDDLTSSRAPVPLFVLVTARPELLERRPAWGRKADATSITLERLSDAGTTELVRSLVARYGLRVRGDSERFWSALVDRVGGNPLFAVEYVRMLSDNPDLTEWTEGADAAIPQSVHSVIASRLDALPAAAKAVLQDASVLGETVWVGAVAAVGGRPRAEVAQCLEYLAQRRLLRRARSSSVARDTEYSFWHVLVRDVAYARFTRAARAERHQRAAAWIERLPTEHTDLLAHHYNQAMIMAEAAGLPTAELAKRARLVLVDAGRKAARIGAYPAAVRCYQAALELGWPQDSDRANGRGS
jgi:DNA-binding SARP family transcriptional activator